MCYCVFTHLHSITVFLLCHTYVQVRMLALVLSRECCSRFVFTFECSRVCFHVRICVCVSLFTFVHIHVCLRTCIHVYVFARAFSRVCVRLCVFTLQCIHAYVSHALVGLHTFTFMFAFAIICACVYARSFVPGVCYSQSSESALAHPSPLPSALFVA